MITRQSTEPGRELRAADPRYLLRMHLDRQSELPGCCKQAFRLRHAEADAFAIHVHGIDQLVGMQRRQPLLRYRVDVFVALAAELRRHGVSCEQGGFDGDRKFAAERPRDAQHLGLVGECQAVARLDLHRRDAFRQHRLQPRGALIEQLLFGGSAHCTHRGKNSTAAARDVLVGGAAQALGIFARPRPREHQVGMTVDQSRCQPVTTQVDDLRRTGGFDGLGRAGDFAHPFDPPVTGQNRAVVDDSHLGVACRQPRIPPQCRP